MASTGEKERFAQRTRIGPLGGCRGASRSALECEPGPFANGLYMGTAQAIIIDD